MRYVFNVVLVCLSVLLYQIGYAGWMQLPGPGSGAVESVELSLNYVGWPNTNGTPNSNPTSSVGSDDELMTRLWTATESGTAKTINLYEANSTSTSPDVAVVVLYRDISGIITLVGQGAYTNSANSWTGEVTLVAESGQTLDFSLGDDLYYGVCFSASDGDIFIGREDSGGDGLWYALGTFESGPDATPTLYESNNRDMGFILSYE